MEIVIELPQDVDKLCRTCMNMVKEDDERNCLFSEESARTELYTMLKFVTGTKLSSADGLPKYMCAECVNKLELSYAFKQQCQNTYLNFQGFLNPTANVTLKEENTTIIEFYCSVCLDSFTSLYRLSRHEIEHYKGETLSDRLENVMETDVKGCSMVEIDTEEILMLIDERKKETYEDNASNVLSSTSEGTSQAMQLVEENIILEKQISDLNVNTIEANEILVCDICDREYESNFQLCLHFINHAIVAESNTDPEVFEQYLVCSTCGETFNSPAIFETHLKDCCSKTVEYKCVKCDIHFQAEIELLKHESNFHHNDGFCWDDILAKSIDKTKYLCPICSEDFSTKQDLTVHSVKHVLKQATCRMCKKTFCSQVAHNNHLRTHPNYKHVCKQCGRCLGSRHALKTHIMGVHSSISNYACPICAKKFKTPSRLYIHKLTHETDKKFKCTICGYKTNNVGDFKVHNRIHTCERPYKCTFVNCNRQFKTSSHLNEHIQRHLQIKKYQCNHCQMVFGHNHTLKMHIMVHTGEKPFACTVCKLKFRRKHHLKNHMKQHNLQHQEFILIDEVP